MNWKDAVRKECKPSTLLPNFTTGAVIGIIQISVCMSFAVMIFSGRLTPGVSLAIGAVLMGGCVMNVIIACLSSQPGMTAAPQDGPAAVAAVMAASIAAAAGAQAQPTTLVWTVLAAMAASTLLTGVFFWTFGRLKAGGLVRFIPYPVIGGFLAGTGWLLLIGALPVMTGVSFAFDLKVLGGLGQADVLVKWLPGALFGAVLFGAKRKSDHFLVLPVLLLAAAGCFYGGLLVTGTPVSTASDKGWLLQGLPAGGLWEPFSPAVLSGVTLRDVLFQTGSLATIVVVSLVQFLLYVSGLEISIRSDMDLDKELQAAGVANLVGGLTGSLAGYHWPSTSVLAHKMNAKSRLVGVFAAAPFVAALISGSSFLPYFPRLILGGLLVYLGLAFLAEWVVDAFFKLPRADYGIVLLILGVIGTVGFLEGVAVGLVGAVALFVIKYSRIKVIRSALSVANFRSNRDRPPREAATLDERGEAAAVFKLQGFIFFGTANSLLQEIKDRFADETKMPLRFAVLDFHRVTGLDSSALLSFAKMKQFAETSEVTLVLTHLSAEYRSLLEKEEFAETEGGAIRFFADLDRGVDWCEQRLLTDAAVDEDQADALDSRFRSVLPDDVAIARFRAYLECLELDDGETFIKQGAQAGEMYFVEKGWVTVVLELPGTKPVRLRTMGPGTVVGETGVYAGSPRTASVATDGPATVLRLPAENVKIMEREDPEVAAAFHRLIVMHLAERLTWANKSLQAMSE